MFGMSKLMMGGGGGGLPDITFVASAVSITSSITIPASSQTGDVAILMDGEGSGIPATPSGWTNIELFNGSAHGYSLSYKILESGDPSSTVSGSVTQPARVMLVFRGSVSPSVTIQDLVSQRTAYEPAAQTVNASASTKKLVVLGCHTIGAAGPANLTGSDTFDSEVVSTNTTVRSVNFAYKIMNASPADFTVDCTDQDSFNSLISFYVEID
jgi:hypothetical protein